MIEQLDMLDFIRRSSRATDPETSRLAAERVAPHVSKGQMEVLAALARGPMTDFQIGEHIGRQQTSCGKRRGELRDRGFVEVALDCSGNQLKRAAPSGSMALVWRITDLGRRFYSDL